MQAEACQGFFMPHRQTRLWLQEGSEARKLGRSNFFLTRSLCLKYSDILIIFNWQCKSNISFEKELHGGINYIVKQILIDPNYYQIISGQTLHYKKSNFLYLIAHFLGGLTVHIIRSIHDQHRLQKTGFFSFKRFLIPQPFFQGF